MTDRLSREHFLLDVNVLVAWGWADHADHDRAADWIQDARGRRSVILFTSSIPQLGFVRVSVQWSKGKVSVAEAAEVLGGMLAGLGSRHRFLADDRESTMWPSWCDTASRTTDAHLLDLADRHGLRLATLDTGIPGAFVIPGRSP